MFPPRATPHPRRPSRLSPEHTSPNEAVAWRDLQVQRDGFDRGSASSTRERMMRLGGQLPATAIGPGIGSSSRPKSIWPRRANSADPGNVGHYVGLPGRPSTRDPGQPHILHPRRARKYRRRRSRASEPMTGGVREVPRVRSWPATPATRDSQQQSRSPQSVFRGPGAPRERSGLLHPSSWVISPRLSARDQRLGPRRG